MLLTATETLQRTPALPSTPVVPRWLHPLNRSGATYSCQAATAVEDEKARLHSRDGHPLPSCVAQSDAWHRTEHHASPPFKQTLWTKNFCLLSGILAHKAAARRAIGSSMDSIVEMSGRSPRSSPCPTKHIGTGHETTCSQHRRQARESIEPGLVSRAQTR